MQRHNPFQECALSADAGPGEGRRLHYATCLYFLVLLRTIRRQLMPTSFDYQESLVAPRALLESWLSSGLPDVRRLLRRIPSRKSTANFRACCIHVLDWVDRSAPIVHPTPLPDLDELRARLCKPHSLESTVALQATQTLFSAMYLLRRMQQESGHLKPLSPEQRSRRVQFSKLDCSNEKDRALFFQDYRGELRSNGAKRVYARLGQLLLPLARVVEEQQELEDCGDLVDPISLIDIFAAASSRSASGNEHSCPEPHESFVAV